MDTIRLQKDFKEFLRLLNEHDVEYLLICGYAVNYYGSVRTTGDMDVWVAMNSQNAAKLVEVLKAFGFSESSVQSDLFLTENKVTQIGFWPNRIDVLTSISGLTFAPCFTRRIVGEIDGLKISLLNLEDLKINKLISGRLKDLNDLENLS